MKTVKVLKFCFLLGTAAAFSPLAAATKIVNVVDNAFNPENVTIQVGDTVEWRNAAGELEHEHNVTDNNGAFQSETASQFTFDHTFDSAGTFNYHCTIHPTAQKGSITVEGGSSGAAELELSEVDAPSGSFAQGASISINAEVRNTGNAASGAFSIDYYASDNLPIGPLDRLIATENRPSLDAGENSNGPFNATIPADLTPGTYFIGAIVPFSDGNGANNNNFDATSITVTAGGSFVINNGLNDTWRDIDTRGQGYFVTVFPDIQKMFVGWFTYDVERPDPSVTAILGEPGHRWVTAFGSYSGDTATLDIELTQGGIFNSGDPAPTQGPYGTMKVEFANCSEGEVTYNIPSVGVSGSVPITRVANDNVARCESLQTR